MVTIKNRTCPGPIPALLAVLTCCLLTSCTPPGPRALLHGKKLLDKGKYEAAIEELRGATDLMPTNAHAWNYLGLAFHHAGKGAEAETSYQRALKLDNDLSEARYNLGCLWLEQEKFDWARTELTAFTLRRPRVLEGFLKLGSVQLRLRDNIAAEKSFSQAVRLAPGNPEALTGLGLALLQRGRHPEAKQQFLAALSRQPGYRPALLNLAVLSQQTTRDPTDALKFYREYLGAGPPPPNAEEVAATIRQLQAELAARATPATRPVSGAGQVAAGPDRAPASTGQVAAPVPSARKTDPPASAAPAVASRPLPDHFIEKKAVQPAPVTTSNRPAATTAPPIVASAPRPDPVETRTTPAETVTLDVDPPVKPGENIAPTRPVANPAAGTNPPAVASAKPRPNVIQRVFGSGTPSTATEPPEPPPFVPTEGPNVSGDTAATRYTYLKVPRLKSGDRKRAEIAFAEGFRAQQAGKLDEAAQAYRRANKADPSFFDAYYNLGVTATSMGDTRLASEAYQYALAALPDSRDARYNFALLLQKAGYLTDAVSQLEAILKSYPNDVRAHLALGNLFAQKLDQPGRARTHYLKVLEADPRHTEAAAIRYWLAAHQAE